MQFSLLGEHWANLWSIHAASLRGTFSGNMSVKRDPSLFSHMFRIAPYYRSADGSAHTRFLCGTASLTEVYISHLMDFAFEQYSDYPAV